MTHHPDYTKTCITKQLTILSVSNIVSTLVHSQHTYVMTHYNTTQIQSECYTW